MAINLLSIFSKATCKKKKCVYKVHRGPYGSGILRDVNTENDSGGQSVSEMHNGLLPGVFSPTVMTHTSSMNDEAPNARVRNRMLHWILHRSRPEEEETIDHRPTQEDEERIRRKRIKNAYLNWRRVHLRGVENEEDDPATSSYDDLDSRLVDFWKWEEAGPRLVNFWRGDQPWEEEEESLLKQVTQPYQEDEEQSESKIEKSKALFRQLVNRPGITRGEIIDTFIRRVGVTRSTAVSYYERIAKESGLTNQPLPGETTAQGATPYIGGPGGQQQMPMANQLQVQANQTEPQEEIPDSGDPNKQGIIRVVKGAHLVYKRRSNEGTFEELWVFNIGDNYNTEREIQQAILAGTDIPSGRTMSRDGQQQFSSYVMGNAQMIHISGLPN